jgi:hypothetical protein
MIPCGSVQRLVDFRVLRIPPRRYATLPTLLRKKKQRWAILERTQGPELDGTRDCNDEYGI